MNKFSISFRGLLCTLSLLLLSVAPGWAWTWTGETVSDGSSYYIYNIGQNYFLNSGNSSTTDINSTAIWKFTANCSNYNITDGSKWIRIYYTGSWSWDKKYFAVTNYDNVVPTTLVSNETSSNGTAYQFESVQASGYYFICSANAFSASKDSKSYSSDNAKFLLISDDQKVVYNGRSLTFSATIGNEESLNAGNSSVSVAKTADSYELTNFADWEGTKSIATFVATADTENGWHFDGWYSDADFKTLVDENTMFSAELGYVNTSVTLYAHFVQTLTPEFSGEDQTMDVDAISESAFDWRNTSAEKPSLNGDFYYEITDNTPSGVTTGSDHATEIIGYDPETNTLTAYNAGTAKITFGQKATGVYAANSATYTITVSKIEATLGNKVSNLEWNTSYNATDLFETNSTAAINITSEDVVVTDNSFTTQTQSAASFKVNLVETYKYTGISDKEVTFTVKQATADVNYVLNESEEFTEAGTNYKDFTLSGPGAKLTFDMKLSNTTMKYVEIKTSTDNGANWTIVKEDFGSTDYKNYSIDLGRDVTNLRFQAASGIWGNATKYWKNILVTRADYLEASATDITIPAIAYGLDQSHSAKVTISYSNVDEMKFLSSDPQFTVSSTQVSHTSDSYGTYELTVTYTPTAAGTTTGTITIYDKAHSLTLNVTGSAVSLEPASVAETDKVFYIANGEDKLLIAAGASYGTEACVMPNAQAVTVSTDATTKKAKVHFANVADDKYLYVNKDVLSVGDHAYVDGQKTNDFYFVGDATNGYKLYFAADATKALGTGTKTVDNVDYTVLEVVDATDAATFNFCDFLTPAAPTVAQKEATLYVGGSDFTIYATPSVEGATLSYAISGTATIEGNVVTPTGAGTALVTVSQAAKGIYLAPANVTVTLATKVASSESTEQQTASTKWAEDGSLYYSSFCSQYNFTLEYGAEAYLGYINSETGNVHLEKIGDCNTIIPAGTGVIIMSTSNTYTAKPTTEEVASETTAALANNTLVGTLQRTPAANYTADGQLIYALNTAAKQFQNYTGAYVPANKAFLVEEAGSAAPSRNIVMDEEAATPTALDALLETKDAAVKVYIDGVLYILKDGKAYLMDGKLVK